MKEQIYKKNYSFYPDKNSDKMSNYYIENYR